jgi:hypothetical protein
LRQREAVAKGERGKPLAELEDLSDIQASESRKDEAAVPWEEVKAEMDRVEWPSASSSP